MLAAARLVAFAPTTDLTRARAFYADLLGLELIDDSPGNLVFDVSGTALRVTEVPELTPQPFTIVGWWVDDVQATVDALVSAGIEMKRYPQLEQDARGLWQPPGSRVQVGWFADPEDNVLSVTGFVSS